MDIWAQWLAVLQGLLDLLSSTFGLSAGASIITLTVILKTLVLPMSWSSAYRGSIRHKKTARLQPQLLRLKNEARSEPHRYADRLATLYRENGMELIDRRSLAAALVQMPLFVGVYQTLRAGARGARFLWIQSLSRPDAWLAVLASVTTLWMVSANPDLPEQLRIALVLVPSIIALIAALKFASALALYWTASNCYAAVQTSAMHYVLARRIKSGQVVI